MDYLDPQQELFTAVKLALEAQGNAVYDGFLPPDGTPYPFVYLADCTQNDTIYKDRIAGTVVLRVHFWHNNPGKRGTVSRMMLEAKDAIRRISHTPHYAWNVASIYQQILSDSTTKTPLLHGVLEIEFKFT